MDHGAKRRMSIFSGRPEDPVYLSSGLLLLPVSSLGLEYPDLWRRTETRTLGEIDVPK